MLQLDLTKDEKAMLLDVLEYDLKELRNEISNTENWEFKKGLKPRQALLEKVAAQLR